MSTTYFLFTVRSSSLRLGCGQKHKPVTDPELRGVAVAAISTDHSHQAPSALPPRGPHLLLGKETDARRASKPQVPPHRFIALPGNAASGAQRSARPRPGGLRRRLRPRWPGRAGRASARRAGRDRSPCAAEDKLAPSRHARASGSPRSRSRPRRQVRPTYSTPGTGGRPAERANGPRHQPGRTTRRRAPPGAAPPPPTGAPRQAQRAAARRAPKESPGGADAEALELTTSSGRGCGSRRPSALRAGELAARGRRQLTGGTAGRSSRRSWNQSGQD